jgi:hypothetical protein
MKFIREHIGFKLLWLVMALHILNCSVDSPDPQPESVPEDLSYNDMESVIEIVLELGFDMKNAVPEQDDQDTDDSGAFSIKKSVDFFVNNTFLTITFNHSFIDLASLDTYKEQYSEQFHPEIVPPPPKA